VTLLMNPDSPFAVGEGGDGVFGLASLCRWPGTKKIGDATLGGLRFHNLESEERTQVVQRSWTSAQVQVARLLKVGWMIGALVDDNTCKGAGSRSGIPVNEALKQRGAAELSANPNIRAQAPVRQRGLGNPVSRSRIPGPARLHQIQPPSLWNHGGWASVCLPSKVTAGPAEANWQGSCPMAET
jgi:hypothetical protein